MAIHVLSAVLVNKIAAGEVIERPASIVKELVENSLDAGAARIDVTIEDGGKRLIAVSDDGAGMSGEDLALAFVPHATSKIADDEDLFAIRTMGFRGEALASVAAVSHAHIRTRRRDAQPDAGGCQIEAGGEQLGQVVPCAAACGTTVTIRDLFFNTPGRRKFLKSANTEFGHVTEQMIRLALPNPQVAFTLAHNGKVVQSFPAAASTAQRAADIFGRELADALLPIVPRQGRGVQVAGLAARPQASRASGTWQYFFLNGRYIRDRLLGHALKEAYRGLTDPNRFPVAFMFLQVDPAEVDVNVHPTKIEVRFRDGQAVHGELLAALRETLNRANVAPQASLETQAPAAPPGDPGAQQGTLDPQRQQSLRQALADFFKSAPAPQPRLGFAESPPPPWDTADPLTAPPPRRGGPLQEAAGAFGAALDAVAEAAMPQAECNDPDQITREVHAPQESPARGAPSAVQFHDSYIVAACEDGIEVIDQHALHERVIYNDLKRRLADGAIASQRLLIPQTLTVTAAEAACAEDSAALLGRLGFDLVSFGPRTLAIQAMPALFAARQLDGPAVVREVLDRLSGGQAADAEAMLEGLLEVMACKAAVKAGDPLGRSEIEALLRRRRELDKASACPHGRPTTLKISLKELEKQFKRI